MYAYGVSVVSVSESEQQDKERVWSKPGKGGKGLLHSMLRVGKREGILHCDRVSVVRFSEIMPKNAHEGGFKRAKSSWSIDYTLNGTSRFWKPSEWGFLTLKHHLRTQGHIGIMKERIYTTKKQSIRFGFREEENRRIMVMLIMPKAKQRPRFTANGRHTYTPKESVEYERAIADCWKICFPDILTGYIDLKCRFYFPIPKSKSKIIQQGMEDGIIRPDRKPDGDNLMKAVQDALNEVAYWDDKQIVHGEYDKFYGDPRVEIEITELKQ